MIAEQMQVVPIQAHRPARRGDAAARPLLAPSGARVVLGGLDAGALAAPAQPAADTLFGPRGAALAGPQGPLFVCDTGNRRVLVWHTLPQRNGAPADLVLGQRDFTTRDAGGGDDIDAAGMRWPHAAALDGGRLFVSDAGTSRIMVWHHLPETDGAPCDAVIGQADFAGADNNRGAYDPTAGSLHLPYGVAATAGHLFVADTANSRLLGYDLAGLDSGMAADRLVGQHDFHGKGENRWERPGRGTLCWPFGISLAGDTAVVADSGNNRLLLWELE
jgi:hypothetical protein